MVDRSSFVPMYQQVKADIEQQILEGKIRIGEKLMSETEMIHHYGVGRVTVRNALAELVASGCLRKEQGLGTFCAALPRTETRKNIDVLLNTGDRNFTPYFLSGISRVLDANDCNLILHDTLDDMATIAKLLQEALTRGTDGVILQPVSGTVQVLPQCAEALAQCKERNIPLVTIDGKFKDIDTPHILNDDEGGCRKAAEHLIGMGHKNILGLFRNRYRDSKFRTAGFRSAIERAGLPVRILDADEASPQEWVAYIRRENITGIVCYNDYLAVKCYHCFHENGLQPGVDVSVVGFDDTEISRSSLPRITTVTHPKDLMGEAAARYLLERIEVPDDQPAWEQYVFPADLICRDSVRNISAL